MGKVEDEVIFTQFVIAIRRLTDRNDELGVKKEPILFNQTQSLCSRLITRR